MARIMIEAWHRPLGVGRWVSQATPDEPGGHKGLGKQVQAVPKVSWKPDRLVGHLLRAG